MVNNALPFTPPGGRVTVRTLSPQADGDQTKFDKSQDQDAALIVEIVDNGQGMTPEVRDRLFTDAAIST